ncbi:unnamed protein product [Orchesella dallaii]|uniref:Odorant receptor n=1 Tax=Orchesella dallaii TaxID=48710 RepID=A0ABP1RMG6_9HEXA
MATIIKQKRKHFKNLFGATWKLDQMFSDLYRTKLIHRKDVRRIITKYELVILFASIFTALFPLAFPITFTQPVDPLHRILEDLLDIEVKFSPLIICVGLSYAWCVFCVCNTFITSVLPIVLASCSCCVWTTTMTPNKLNGQKYNTKRLGNISPQMIIHVYRCYEVLWSNFNDIFSNIRTALHLIILHIVMVISSYICVKHTNEFILQREYVFAGIIIAGVVVPLIITKLECLFLGGMREDSQILRNNLVNLSNQAGFVYKSAVSFRLHCLKVTHPFFTVSYDTFLEFVNISVDHILNLLLLK